jgi:hypothetical protein
MGFRLREIEAESKFVDEFSLDGIAKVVSQETVKQVLMDAGMSTPRKRKLNLEITVFIIIGMGLYSHLAIGKVLNRLVKGLRFIWHDPNYPVAKDNAISYRRKQLGARPMVKLFHEVCRPIATEETPGAFLFGLRVMAIDGTSEDLADTPANEAYFGRPSSGRDQSAFPQMRGVYLAECGTHAIIDAGFWPLSTGEEVGGFRLLRSVTEGMLVTWDRGFHSFDMIVDTRKRGAHVLGRLPANVQPRPVLSLPDGSHLAYLFPSEPKRRRRGEHLLVRIISYIITDEALPGYGEKHRLVTTLLSHQSYPVLDLVYAYHERWEIELVIDEIDTHQRLLHGPLRSKSPAAVIQEIYGLLIAHFIIRFLMHEAACQAGIDPDRLSFSHALEVIQNSVDEFQITATEQLGALYQRLLSDIAAGRLPPRRVRSNPRVVKRKMSKFPKKRPKHDQWPQPTRPWHEAIALI